MRQSRLVFLAALAGCAALTGCAAHAADRGAQPGAPEPPPPPPIVIPGAVPIGWATVSDMGQTGTTGGGAVAGVRAGTPGELIDALAGEEPRVILLMHSVRGTFDVGSNKTVVAMPNVVVTGSLSLDASVNVIVRNLKVVGYNCSDSDECKRGHDAVTITNGAHHIWFDHCDISDGSDGNLDINAGSDYVTISWTKFSYSGRRPGAHQYSNLLSSSDESGDTDRGHLRVTFHHVWWAENVSERMPRVRFGQVHVFNSLYTSTGNRYCVGVGASASLLVENCAFIGVRTPIESRRFADAASAVTARGNLLTRTDGAAQSSGGPAFTPPYRYELDPVETVQAAVMRGAGPPGAAPAPSSSDEDDDSGSR